MFQMKIYFLLLIFLIFPPIIFGQCKSTQIEVRTIKDLDFKYFMPSKNSECSQMIRWNAPNHFEHTEELFSPLEFKIMASLTKPYDDFENCHIFLAFYNKSSERKFKWFNSIHLYVDGKSRDFGPTSRDIEYVTDYEKLTIDVTYEQLKMLANAKDITGKIIFNTDFKFGECEFCQLRAMVKKIKEYYRLKN